MEDFWGEFDVDEPSPNKADNSLQSVPSDGSKVLQPLSLTIIHTVCIACRITLLLYQLLA